MGRPRVHDEATRQALLRAADAMVAEGGPRAISVRPLARAAGTSTRAVYSVFGSKDNLVSALCREAFRELIRVIDALPITDDPATDLVNIGVDGFRRFALARPNLFHLVFERVEVTGREPDEAAAAEHAMSRLRLRVERFCRVGLSGGHSVEFVATTFHALCQGLTSMELQGRRWDSRPARMVWTEALRALIAGLRDGTAGPPKRLVRRARRRAADVQQTASRPRR